MSDTCNCILTESSLCLGFHVENGTGTCQDIDECTDSPCTEGQCHNLPGGQYTVTVDECTDSPCTGGQCHNLPGGQYTVD